MFPLLACLLFSAIPVTVAVCVWREWRNLPVYRAERVRARVCRRRGKLVGVVRGIVGR